MRSGVRPRMRSLRIRPRCAAGVSLSMSGRKMRPSRIICDAEAERSSSASAASRMMKGRLLTGDSACMERAAASAPHPGSPVMMAARKCGATRRICDQTRAIAVLGPRRASSPMKAAFVEHGGGKRRMRFISAVINSFIGESDVKLRRGQNKERTTGWLSALLSGGLETSYAEGDLRGGFGAIGFKGASEFLRDGGGGGGFDGRALHQVDE